jgi:hypothetical protein
MSPLFGLAALHLAGAVALTVGTRAPLPQTVRSPSSSWVAVAVLYAVSLGVAGVPLLLLLGGAAVLVRRQAPGPIPRLGWAALGLLAVVVLARPWVPTQWDEFVWLGKARFESLRFGAGVVAALDPGQHLIPPGYPPLWPAAVGWLGLGADALGAQVLAASLVLLLCVGAAVEGVAAALPSLRPRGAVAVLLVATPFVWIHLRSTYVDLPVGLLGVALLANLLSPSRLVLSTALALVLVAVKDEGLAHVVAATLAAALVRRSWTGLLPGAAGLVGAVIWRLLVRAHGVTVVDHALDAPQWSWVSTLGRLLFLHASDVVTWGVFWAVAVVAAVGPPRLPLRRASRAMLGLNLAFLSGALVLGPERVRAFAENGTLLNRLLIQLWPSAALTLVLALDEYSRRGPDDARAPR